MSKVNHISFNKPFIVGRELEYITEAVSEGHLSGDGKFTKKCHEFLENYLSANKVLLTHSCTGALEMAAILCDVKPGDEVILPSYTFVSTANAFLLRGAKLIFADINEHDLNISVEQIKSLVTEKTKVICPVHYAGVPCDMNAIMDIAIENSLYVVEDAAQALGVNLGQKKLGTIGDFGTFSFHETKNLISGEGGALTINNSKFEERAEIIREKGTNRSRFLRGAVDKYTWVDMGSSYLPSELISAFLYAQLEHVDEILLARKEKYTFYYDALQSIENLKGVKLPTQRALEISNHHIFYLIMPDKKSQEKLITALAKQNIKSVFHYIPLHSSPIGRQYHDGRELIITDQISERIIRLPLFYDLTVQDQVRVVDEIKKFISNEI